MQECCEIRPVVGTTGAGFYCHRARTAFEQPTPSSVSSSTDSATRAYNSSDTGCDSPAAKRPGRRLEASSVTARP